jgi:hypothetical protein
MTIGKDRRGFSVVGGRPVEEEGGRRHNIRKAWHERE